MNVELFTIPSDPYSERLKEFLRRKNILFKEIVVISEESKALLLKKTGSDRAPQLVVDDILIGDYERVLPWSSL